MWISLHVPFSRSQFTDWSIKSRTHEIFWWQAMSGFSRVRCDGAFFSIIYHHYLLSLLLWLWFCFDEGSRALIGIVPTLGKRCFALAGRSWAGPCGRQHLDLAWDLERDATIALPSGSATEMISIWRMSEKSLNRSASERASHVGVFQPLPSCYFVHPWHNYYIEIS